MNKFTFEPAFDFKWHGRIRDVLCSKTNNQRDPTAASFLP